jgi:hypothetical protein
MTQVHDFNPGIGTNGLFWIVQIPDDAVTITDNTVTISLSSVAVVDQLTFPNPGSVNLGNSGVAATVSFNITYQKSGGAHHVSPTSEDPLSPFNWVGEMSPATNSGTFKLAYNDGSFSAQGSFSSAGNFGEMGTERNGSFVRREDRDEGDKDDKGEKAAAGLASTSVAESQRSASATQPANSAKWRGKVPVEYFLH